MISYQHAIIAVLICLAFPFSSSSGQQMRIETEVLIGDDKQLASKSLTLFDGALIYDFLFTENENQQFALDEIVVFDRLGQSVTLLDQKERRKLVLSHTDLLSMSAAMKASETLRQKDQFLLEPKFQQSADDNDRTLVLSSPRMTYQCECQWETDPKQLLSYFHFADWAARLNVSDSHKMPPFARLQLNEALRKRGWIPTKVQLELSLTNGQRIEATAQHHRLNQLSENDQLRIQQAKDQMRRFSTASLVEYRDLSTVSAK